MVKRKLDQSVEREDPPIKKPCVFDASDFRRQLHGAEFLKQIRNFLNIAGNKNVERDVVSEYLENGGSILELVSLLDITAQADLVTAAPIFRAIYFILLKVQSFDGKYQDDSKSGIEKLLSNFTPAIKAMISMNSQRHRKIVYKMLTAIVTFNHVFGREILQWFSLTNQQIDQMIEPGPLRRTFIMFLMSFFVEKKSTLLRPLLQKKGMISSIIPNLLYDDVRTVCLVLTVLREKILENSTVTKTVKLEIFNTQIIQAIIRLYDWIGPRGVQVGWKKIKGQETGKAEERDAVTSALNPFLRVLCSNRKYGVVFWDKGLGLKTSSNQLVFTALEALPRPWERSDTFDLVVGMLKNCPDLIKPCLSRMESSFQPRDSEAWRKAMDLISKVYSSLEPESILPPACEVLTDVQIHLAIRSILIIPAVTKNLTKAAAPESPPMVQYHAIALLTVIIRKLSEFMRWLQDHSKLDAGQKKKLSLSLQTIIPSGDNIRKLWRSHSEETGDFSWDENIVNYLLAVALFDASLLDGSRKLCKSIAKGLQKRGNNIQIAILQIISLLEPSYLSPESDLFEDALKTLLKLSIPEGSRPSSLSAISRMLQSCDVFTSHPLELDCWLAAWFRVPEKAQEVVSEVFIAGLRKAITTAENEESMDTNSPSDDVDLTNPVISNSQAPSPVLANVFNAASMRNESSKSRKKEIIRFLTDVAINIGHMYGPSKLLLMSCIKNQHLLSFDVASYLTEEDSDVHILPFPEQQQFRQYLLNPKSDAIDYEESCSNPLKASLLFNMSVFYLIRRVFKGEIHADTGQHIRSCMNSIISSICKPGAPLHSDANPIICMNYESSSAFFQSCMRVLLKESNLINQFSLIDKNDSGFTSWLKEFLHVVDPNRTISGILLLPWKQRFLYQLKLRIEKRKKLTSLNLEFWFDYLRLSLDESTQLLHLICEISEIDALPKGWGPVALGLVRSIGTEPFSVDLQKKMVTVLSAYCTSNESEEAYDEALLVLLTNFPHCVFHLQSEFLQKLVLRPEVSSALLRVAEICLLIPQKAIAFLKILEKNPELPCNITILMEFLEIILDRNQFLEGMHPLGLSSNWCEEITSKTNGKTPPLLQCLRDVLKGLYPQMKKHVKKCLRGEMGEKYDNVMRAIFRIGGFPGLPKLIGEGSTLSPLIMIDALNTLEDSKEKEKVLLNFLTRLCSPDAEDFERNSKILLQLSNVTQGFQAWKQFVKSSMYKNLCDHIVNFDTSTNPYQIALLHITISNAWGEDAECLELKIIFARIATHSEFLNIMLADSPLKQQIVHLLLILLNRCPSLMVPGQVPVFLGAYNASLSECDQYLLQRPGHQLLSAGNASSETQNGSYQIKDKDQKIRLNCVDVTLLPHLRIFSFINSNFDIPKTMCVYIMYFTIMKLYEKKCTTLSQFEPLFWGEPAVRHYSVRESLWNPTTAKSVLELLNIDKVKSTIAEFPLERNLDGQLQASKSNVYDPAFLIPLFCNLFSPSAVSYCESFVIRGGLSMTLAALSSHDKAMRMAAATVLHRFYSHVQLLQRSKHKLIWLHIVDCVRFGLDNLTQTPAPSISTVFFARALLEISDPLSPLFSLHHFILAKPAFNLNSVPEFSNLFFSPDHHHQKHRSWVLNVLHEGIRQDADFNIVYKSFIIGVILCYYESTLATLENKSLILQILSKMCKFSQSDKLFTELAILTWIRHIAPNVNADLTKPLFQLLSDLNECVRTTVRPQPVRSDMENMVKVVIRTILTSLAGHSTSASDGVSRTLDDLQSAFENQCN